MLARHIQQGSLAASRRRIPHHGKLIARHLSQGEKPKTPAPVEDALPSPEQERFVYGANFTFNYFGRFLKYSAISLVAVSFTTYTAFECAHMYVESAALAPERDEEVRRWQWDVEAERWTGGEAGGTDPGLGYVGRHALRGGWMAQNWGTGSGGSVIGSKAFTGQGGAGGLNVVEARLEYAQEFISAAMQAAEQRMGSGNLRPQTMVELLARHANVLERMGTRDGLFEARTQYERVWAGQAAKGIEAARTALKLGDVNYRLGDIEGALSWWSRTMQLLTPQQTGQPASGPFPAIPPAPPSEPLAQRTFISLLVSLSAFLSTTGQLRHAKAVQETSLNVLRSIRQPDSFETASPPQALHALYILHRSSLLSIHLAEVLYALRSKPVASLEYLARAADSSERVALALTGLPPIHPDAPESKIPHPPSSETPLLSAYSKSVSMSRPAKSLLRDARRTAAEAWSLMGVLTESSDAAGSMEKALEYYERALGWAGVAADRAGGIGQAGEGTLEAEWNVLWSNYVHARDAVRARQEKK